MCTRDDDGRFRTSPVRGIWLDGALVFRAGEGRLGGADTADLPAAVVQLDEGERLTLIEGSATRVTEPTLLSRFESQLRAKYGVDPESGVDEAPVYALRV